MREVHRSQFQLGQVPVEKVWINPKSRDDIPAVLKGLQHIWCDEALRARLFVLLDEHILPEADRTVGRPGMDLWQILVLGVLKQGLGCDFDRLHDLTNHHQTIRAFLGHGDFDDKTRYEYQTVVDNVSLLTPELLSAVGRLVVESGHKVAKKKPGEPLRGRCDSFVVETDVHYPTDVSLLWDAVRCLLRETGLTAEQYAVRGWRQWRHLSREVKKLFNRVRSTRRAQRHPERVAAYVERCRALVERAEATLDVLRGQGVGELGCRSISGLVAHARRQIDQVERRLLRGETIPHEEKVFSIFEEHTRWVSKGKAGTPVELGVLSPLSKTSMDSSFTTRSCGRVRMWTWQCRWCRKRRHCIRSCGRAVSTGAFIAATIGSASMRCSTSMRCRGEDIFQEPTGNGKRRSRLLPRGVRIRRSSLPSMGWSIGDSTEFAAMVRTASRVRLPCRCWRPTCIASG